MNRLGVVLFHTTSAALRAEKAVLAAGLAATLIPTPREFSSDCGIALRFDWSAAARIAALLADAAMETAGIHELPAEGV
jgi:hypothetical protein